APSPGPCIRHNINTAIKDNVIFPFTLYGEELSFERSDRNISEPRIFAIAYTLAENNPLRLNREFVIPIDSRGLPDLQLFRLEPRLGVRVPVPEIVADRDEIFAGIKISTLVQVDSAVLIIHPVAKRGG